MPTLTLLDDAMLRPGRMVPAVHRLGGGMIAMAGHTQPSRVVGTSAVVYQLRQPTGRVLALRCFLEDTLDPLLTDRYRGLMSSQTLRRLKSAPQSPIVGGLAYLPEALTFPAADFRSLHAPVVAMEWVPGPTLLAAADRACRIADKPYLNSLASAWFAAICALSDEAVAHGNLTGDNAIVRQADGIALVDYDTMTWPGSPKVRTKARQPGYDHPRGVASNSERRDDFAALVIYVSLRILAIRPELRDEHGDASSKSDGVLLFAANDLAHPDKSPLFNKLRTINDTEIQALVGVLREACLVKVDDVPFFREAVSAAVHVAKSMPAARPSAGLEPSDRQRRLTRLNSLLLAGDDDAAKRFWQTSGLQEDPEAVREIGSRIADLDRKPAARSAPTRVAPQLDFERTVEKPATVSSRPPASRITPAPSDIDRLRVALSSGDAKEIARLWPIVRNEPAAAAYSVKAIEVLSQLSTASIARAVERGDDQGVIAAIEEAQSLGIALGRAARQAGRNAVQRIRAREQLAVALQTDDRETLATLALSGQLESMGRLQETTMRSIERALQWPLLVNALGGDDDRAIMNVFDPDVFSAAAGLSEAERRRIDLAQRRLRWLDRVRGAIRKRDVATLRVALEEAPEGAKSQLSKVELSRIERLTTRERAVSRLSEAMSSRDDIAIVDALNEVESVGATLPDNLDWQAVRNVVDRLSLAAAIRRAATATPRDYVRLARLLPAARDASNGETPYLGSSLDFAELEKDVTQAAARARIRDAILKADEGAIVAAAVPDVFGVLPTLTQEERAVVEKAVKNQRGTDPLRRVEREDAAKAATQMQTAP